MNKLEKYYKKYCSQRSDINEHLPTLKLYASECDHITEMGVREGISTWAFLMGYPEVMVSYDIKGESFINKNLVEESARVNNIDYAFIEADTLSIDIHQTDLLFIDTYHAYGQLIRELRMHSKLANKYIILHDTVSYANTDMASAYKVSEFNDDSKHGLMPAVKEFLKENKDWEIKKHYLNNNGLLVMKRIGNEHRL